jgi:molybdopterin converting factor small subunit
MNIFYHSWIAQQIEKQSDTIDVEHAQITTVHDLINHLSDKCKACQKIFKIQGAFYLSINDVLETDFQTELSNDSRINIFPPLSGG